MKRIAILPALALLAACGANDNDPGPGGVTVGEAKALDDAAEMLEQRRLPADALGDPSEAAADPDGTASPSPTPDSTPR